MYMRHRWLLSALSLSLGMLPMPVTAQQSVHADTVQAQWQQYDFNFAYMGFATYYSCSGLEGRLKQILRDLGARHDVRVSATGCFESDHVSKILTAHVRVNMPIAATLDGPSADATQFAAQQQLITLSARTNGEVYAGDCELVEQVRDRLLPVLKLKVVQDSLRCIPGHPMVGDQTLQMSALIAEHNAVGK